MKTALVVYFCMCPDVLGNEFEFDEIRRDRAEDRDLSCAPSTRMVVTCQRPA